MFDFFKKEFHHERLKEMELSILIARMLGVFYVVIGLGILLNGKFYRNIIDYYINSPGAIYLGGVIALVVGFLIVSYHNIWDGSWRVIISIIGWIALVKGISLLTFPAALMKLAKPLFLTKRSTVITGIIVLGLGLVFVYFGFCPVAQG